MRALSADFETHGETVIETVRTTAVTRIAAAGSRPPACGGCCWCGRAIRTARDGRARPIRLRWLGDCGYNACTACKWISGPLYGAQELSCAARWCDLALDRTEQCCGVCLPILADRGSAPWPPLRLSLHTPSRRPTFRPPTFFIGQNGLR